MEPRASRPDMAAYGVLPPDQGTGLLPWSWAVERLERSHDFWVATSRAAGPPSVTPVWGRWLDGGLWFSCDSSSRKSRNLRERPELTVTTDDPKEPVIVEGRARLADHRADVERFAEAMNAFYEYQSPVEFFLAHDVWRVTPTTVFGLVEADFTGSPTRWRFDG